MDEAPGLERRQAEVSPPAAYISIQIDGQLVMEVIAGQRRGRGSTVSATETVSFRSRRSSKTSWMRGRREAGGNSLMMMLLSFDTNTRLTRVMDVRGKMRGC